jgi:large subunit ribosomal protein L3
MSSQPGVIGEKVGFTQYFTADGTVKRVSVVKAGPLVVVGKRTQEKDGYTALIFGMNDAKEKHLTKSQLGTFKKANVAPKRIVRELRCDAEFAGKFEVGGTVKLDEIFKEGQFVDAQGTTIGRGFTGVVRRWGFAGGTRTHGTHEYRRHGGSIGTNMTPGRTLPNIKMGGQYGSETVSILNLKIARVDSDKNLLLIEGGIPGSASGVVVIRHAVKKRLKNNA